MSGMRAAARGRMYLKGQWKGALTVQGIRMAAALLLAALEWLVVRLVGLNAVQVLHVADLADSAQAVWRLLILAGIVLLDALALSPLHVGRAAYYRELTQRKTAQDATCRFQVIRILSDERPNNLLETREFQAVSVPFETAVSPRILWRFYKTGYRRALGWRLTYWGKKLLYAAITYIPAALLWGMAEQLRNHSSGDPLTEISRIFCWMFSVMALIGGWLVQQLLLLRYMPAVYDVAGGMPVRQAFRTARRRMKGHVGEMAWLYVGFAGWAVACGLVLPSLYVGPLFDATRAAAVHRLPVPKELPRKRRLHRTAGGKRALPVN